MIKWFALSDGNAFHPILHEALLDGSEQMNKERAERDGRLDQLVLLYTNVLSESLSRRSGASRTQALAALQFATQSLQ